MIMKYKDLQFLSNPSVLEIMSDSRISDAPVFLKGSRVQNVAERPTRIKAEGSVYGEEGEEWCSRMKFLLKDKKSGWLFTPSAPPIKAFLSSFSFRRESTNSRISYKAEFCEESGDCRYEADVRYTRARSGENAFDIAYRCDISVDRLEELNGFASPFEINENDRVMIR